jgi:hypothetical protein
VHVWLKSFPENSEFPEAFNIASSSHYNTKGVRENAKA